MGRKRWSTRLIVEQCQVSVSIVWLHRLAWLFDRAQGETVWLTLPNLYGDPLAQIECRYTFSEPHGLVVLIRAEDAGGAILCYQQMIPIVTTSPNFGGQRYWFRCDCGEQVGRLFLRDSPREFQCRHCLNLIYESARTHDATLYEMAKDEAAVDRALSSGVHSKRLRGIDALRLRLKWAKRGRWYE